MDPSPSEFLGVEVFCCIHLGFATGVTIFLGLYLCVFRGLSEKDTLNFAMSIVHKFALLAKPSKENRPIF